VRAKQQKTIELYVPLALNAQSARAALERAMRQIGERSGSSDRLALAIHLQDLHVDVRGEVRVPVEMEVEDRPIRWEYALAVRAASDEGFFPTFAGTLSITPVGGASELWLQGAYKPPFGAIGALLDRTVLRHAAQRSLQSFLLRLANFITDAVDRQDVHRIRDVGLDLAP